MTFNEILSQTIAMLHQHGRVSYRALKRQFAIDDALLEDLIYELIAVQQLAVDHDGTVLVWTGDAGAVAGPPPAPGLARAPLSYTPRHLAERILAEQAALEARGTPGGERKTITALFADIKGSMALLEDHDPEEARRIIDPALMLMMEAVHHYEGYVAQSLGDGIFALFGAPIAHEDHAQRALYAALRMQEVLTQYSQRLRGECGVTLEIRVGVNTGEVVVRAMRTDDLHTDYVPIGHATSLAARLQNLASGGAIVVSAPTYTLTEGYFAFKPLGAAQIRGVSEPVPLYEVVGVGPLRTRLEVAARRGLVQFVGRQGELAQLQQALEQAKGGPGQVVGVVGEPGVGKSRLCYEFKLLAQRGCLVLETFAVSHAKAYPYLPLLELLKHYFHLTPQDDARRREHVTEKLLALDRGLEDTLPYLLALLGDAESTALLAQMDPALRRQRTLEAITWVLLRESLNQPLLLLVEDLQWLDSETDAWLHLLSDRIPTAPILLLVNYRPEYQHAWGSRTYYTQLRLEPLGQEGAHALLTALLGDGPDLNALQELILAKTEGNPFFMEEIVQTLVEQGLLVREVTAGGHATVARLTESLTELQLPPTVQGVLTARIDRLAVEEKALLQTLAVIGKAFPLSLLTHVVGQPEGEVQGLLTPLQRGGFIYEQPGFPELEYTFKHPLTQEVAYNALLLERRRALHERTAQAIEALFQDRLEDHYSELTHHYSRSGNTAKAVEYLQRAGQQAVQRSAYVEAISHVTTALDLLKTLPHTIECDRQALDLQTTLAQAWRVTKGIASPEVEQAAARARELCQQMGETRRLFPVLSMLEGLYRLRAELSTAQELAEHLLRLAQRTQEPIHLALAHYKLGQTLFSLGELVSARVHLEQAMAIDGPQAQGTHAFRSLTDACVPCLSYAAWGLWLLGYPDQALERSQEALTLAHEQPHPFSLAQALLWAAGLRQFRRERAEAQARAEAAMLLSTEQGFPDWLAVGTMQRGWALAAQGHGAEGIAQIHQGLAALRAAGVELGRAHWLALLAEAYGYVGQTHEGLNVLAEALAAVHHHGGRWWEAELYRLRGELLLHVAAQQEEVEACLQQALAVAHRQQAKSLELRAALSLSRLWQQQGKRAEAHELLAEVYGWFTEGFDTADLQEAKALRDALA